MRIGAVKTGVLDLIHEHKIGTEIFVTVATLVAVFGGETVAGAVLMVTILIAEFIAELNTDRARASIKVLIGSVPQVALVRTPTVRRLAGRRAEDRRRRARSPRRKDPCRWPRGRRPGIGERGVHHRRESSEDKATDSPIFAGTLVESGALDIRTERLGADTTFSRIIALVERAEAEQAPVQKLADKVAAWLIPVVFVFLIVVHVFTRDVRTIVTLMIFTSPAELGLATPLVMIAAIARGIHRRVEPHPFAMLHDACDTDGSCKMSLAGSRPADQHRVVCLLGEAQLGQLLDQLAIYRRGIEVEASQVAMRRELRSVHLVADRTHRAVGGLGLQQVLHDPARGLELRVALLLDQIDPGVRHAVQAQRL
jgi:hypothetical protein